MLTDFMKNMKNMKKRKHLDIILSEMFLRVGEEYSPSKTQEEEWYWTHEWTEKERDEFVKWLAEYLYNNKEARQEIVNYPIKNKKRCADAANWFELNYGWKIKQE